MAGFGTKTSRAAAALGAYVDEKFDNAIEMAQAMAAQEAEESATRQAAEDQAVAARERAIAAGDEPPPRFSGASAADPNSGEFTQLYMLQAEFGKATAANQVANGIIKGVNEDQKDASRVK